MLPVLALLFLLWSMALYPDTSYLVQIIWAYYEWTRKYRDVNRRG